MSLTGNDLKTRVQRRTSDTTTEAGQVILDILDGLLQEVYHYQGGHWPWRIRYFELTTQAPYTTGTISGSAGSTSITGSGTAWTGITGYDSAEDPFFLVVGSHVYRIDSIDGDGALTLKSALAEAVDGETYGIYRPWVDLDSTCEELVGMKCHPYGALHRMTLEEAENRFLIYQTSSVPAAFAPVPDTSGKVRRVAIYPFLTEAKHIRYVGYAAAPDVSSGTVDCGCPDGFATALVHGVLAELAVSYDDRPDLAQPNRGLFERKLDQLWLARDRAVSRALRRSWCRDSRIGRNGFFVTQETWNAG